MSKPLLLFLLGNNHSFAVTNGSWVACCYGAGGCGSVGLWRGHASMVVPCRCHFHLLLCQIQRGSSLVHRITIFSILQRKSKPQSQQEPGNDTLSAFCLVHKQAEAEAAAAITTGGYRESQKQKRIVGVSSLSTKILDTPKQDLSWSSVRLTEE